MSECNICTEIINNNNYTTECNHSFCILCIRRWLLISATCPICRSECSTEIKNKLIREINLQLGDSEIEKINELNIDSPKGISKPINEEEIIILERYFGPMTQISYSNINELNINKLMIQEYKNNTWWVGKLDRIDENDVYLLDTICIQRWSGHIFNSKPSNKIIKINEDDTLFLSTF